MCVSVCVPDPPLHFQLCVLANVSTRILACKALCVCVCFILPGAGERCVRACVRVCIIDRVGATRHVFKHNPAVGSRLPAPVCQTWKSKQKSRVQVLMGSGGQAFVWREQGSEVVEVAGPEMREFMARPAANSSQVGGDQTSSVCLFAAALLDRWS